MDGHTSHPPTVSVCIDCICVPFVCLVGLAVCLLCLPGVRLSVRLSVCLMRPIRPPLATKLHPSASPPPTRLRENQTCTQPHSHTATQHSPKTKTHYDMQAEGPPSLCAPVCMA
uniref:Uncharacterized protein n=1 Tax=Vitrella brassicaformis TaxID=1169539 RepID=A0A7S1P3R9_9ALVE